MTPTPLDRCQIFTGEANAAEARVYVRLPLDDLPEEWRARHETLQGRLQLSGSVSGPHCRYAKTLDFSVRIVDRGPGESPLAEAIIPDPCFWSPDLPFLYRVSVVLKSDGTELATTEAWFGVRTLGVRGQRLVWDGKPWVLRAASVRVAPERPLTEWRDTLLTMFTSTSDDAFLAEASQAGAMLAVDLRDEKLNSENMIAELWRCSRSPAVIMACVDSLLRGIDRRRLPPNLLIGKLGSSNSPTIVSIDLDWFLAESPDIKTARSPDFTRPRVISQVGHVAASVAEAREQCDALQRQVAAIADWSGYIVI